MKTELEISNLTERDQVASILVRNGYTVSQRIHEQPSYSIASPRVSLVVEKGIEKIDPTHSKYNAYWGDRIRIKLDFSDEIYRIIAVPADGRKLNDNVIESQDDPRIQGVEYEPNA